MICSPVYTRKGHKILRKIFALVNEYLKKMKNSEYLLQELCSSLLSAVRVVSFPYLRLLIFLLAILIPACDSSSPVFLVMYSAYKLNKHSDNMQPCHTPFPNRLICLSYVHEHFKNMLSHFSCVLLFVALWAVACQAPLSMGFSRQ